MKRTILNIMRFALFAVFAVECLIGCFYINMWGLRYGIALFVTLTVLVCGVLWLECLIRKEHRRDENLLEEMKKVMVGHYERGRKDGTREELLRQADEEKKRKRNLRDIAATNVLPIFAGTQGAETAARNAKKYADALVETLEKKGGWCD